MPVTNADYQIKIRSDLDGKGIKQAGEEFDALAKETKLANEQLAQTATTHQDVSNKAQEAGHIQQDAAKKSTLSHRELREAVGAVGRQFGGLADVGLWLNPELAALAAVLIAVEAIKRIFEQLKAPIDAANAAIQAISDAKLKAAAESARSLSSALSSIADEEDRLDAAYRTGDEAIDARIKKYDEEKSALLKLEEAKEKAYEAEIDREVALGLISKETGEALKEKARLTLDAERGATDQAKLHFEIEQRSAQLSDAQGRLNSSADLRAIGSADAAAGQTNTRFETTAAAQKSVEEGPITANGKTYKNRKELAEAQTEAASDLQEQEERGGWASGTPEEAAIVAVTKQVKAQKAAIDEALRSHDAYVAELARETEQAKETNDSAKSRLDTQREQLKHDEKLNRSGPARIKSLQDQYDIQQKSNADIQRVNTQAAQSRIGTAAAASPAGRAAVQSNIQQSEADLAIQATTQGERGPQAAIDANKLIATGKILESHLRNKRPQDRSAGDLAQTHRIMEEAIGFLQNHSQELNSQRSAIAALRDKLREIERTQDNHTWRLGQSMNTFQ